jgi:DHA1 family tetracycline resistance protein-like MFS transporter
MSHTRSPIRSALLWSRFGPILAVHFLGTLGFSLALPFLVFIVIDLGGAAWTYGLLGATYSAFQLFGAPVLGRWSDTTGRRPVLIASQVGTLGAWLLFLVALSLPAMSVFELAGATLTLPLLLIFLARAIDGSTGGNISVANAYVADLTRNTPALRQIAFGRMGMAANLGFVIGPAAAGLLGGTTWGPRLPVAIAAGFAALTTLAILLWLDEPEGRCPKGPPPPGALEAGLNQQAKQCHTADQGIALWRAIASKPVAFILVATFLIFLGFNFFYAGFPVHAASAYGWQTGELGLFFALLSGIMVVAQGPLLSVASRTLAPPVLFAVGMGVLLVSFVAFRQPSGIVTWLGAAGFAVGNGLSWPTFQARVAEVGGDAQGAIQGAVTSAASLASIMGLVLGGLLYPALGGSLFLVAAGLFGLLLLLTPVWFGRRGARTPIS